MTQNLRARRYFISGVVQGVGFRFFVDGVARRLGVCGFVRNRRDERVEVYAIGSAENLSLLRLELERGPRAAEVDGVTEEAAPLELQYANGFLIEDDL
ncbi:MAG TPA: acylphosphatase [Candidatus Acidoferrales bacterium]|nr:acylphosphatase [Candidatus Acidoferrales bacterium]